MDYHLVVNDRQLHYIRLAMKTFIENDPSEELDESGFDIPTRLCDMLGRELAAGPVVNVLAT